ncbi:AI-2E family transporter [Actinomycetospora cinnamomea]|uniref:Putative PurR-regulated permease PerM n=1 Tax=Actinomycetospora cinnamomea TaxID=663609 RepID=A0A2U1FRJ7_9PSEU|nr:AI-2E family transporter [Actinomycetospora cinnamomea]PVZ14793.1 putative PurR-regulated permease PerM [Actinomycetospora cinnamomea]
MTDIPADRPARPRRMPLEDYAAITATVLVVLALAGAVVVARGAIVLVFVGFFLATGIEPAIRWLVARGLRRGLAVAVVVLLVLLVLIGLAAVLIVPAVTEISYLVAELPDRLAALGERLGGPGSTVGGALSDPAAHQQLQQSLSGLGTVVAASAAAVFSVLGALFGGVFATITVLALLVYFSLAMPRIRAGMDRLLAREERVTAAEAALGRIGGYVSGQLVVSGIAGLSAFAFFLIVGIPYPALLAIVVAVLDAVPQIGATLASFVAVAAALTVSFPLAIGTLVYFMVYQGVENYLIAPRVFSKAIELSPVGAFVAILIGGAAAGLLGAMTALPLTAAGKVVIGHVLSERARRHGRPAPALTPDPSAVGGRDNHTKEDGHG